MVRKSRRKGTIVTGVALGLLSGLVTTSFAAEKTVLQALVSGNQQYIDNIRRVFDEFERLNPDIKIEIQQTDDVGPKFRVMYAGGTPPDLLRMRGNEPAEFGTEGMIEDLTARIKADPGLPMSDFLAPAFESLGWGGRTYALPLGITIQAMLYNKDIFDKSGVPYPDASWTWERDVIQHGRKMTLDFNGDGKIDQYFLGGLGTLEWYPFVYAAGGALFDSNASTFLANSPAGADGLQFAADLMNSHRIAPTRAEQATGAFAFEKGNIAMNITGSWFIGTLRQMNVNFPWDAANVPTFRNNRATNLWPETPWGIPSTSKNKAAAWRVIRFIASKEGQELIARIGLATPIRLSVARGPAYLEQKPPANIMAFIEAASASRTRAIPSIPGWGQIWPVLRDNAIYPAYDGTRPASQALAAAEPQINALLKELQSRRSR